MLILEISNERMNKILSNKFLDIIGETVQFEFLSEQKGNNNNNSINNNTINIKNLVYLLTNFLIF